MTDRLLRTSYWPPTPEVPYLAVVERSVRDAGVEIGPMRLRSLWNGTDVVHLHWPDLVWAARHPVIRVRSLATVVAARLIARRRRLPFVVTCHNLDHHEGASRIGDLVQRWLIEGADRVVVLSESGIDRLCALRPGIERTSIVTIHHPLFDDRYTRMDPAAAAAAAPFVPERRQGEQTWVYFGKVRPYKGLAPLLDSLRAAPELRVRLVLLGERYPRGTQRELLEASANDERVTHVDRRVSDEEIAAACSLADAVVLPYLRTENSGAALTAVTLDAPIVVPDVGVFAELHREVGDRIQLYSPPVDAAEVFDLVERAQRAEPARTAPFQAATIGRQHADLYRSLVATATGG